MSYIVIWSDPAVKALKRLYNYLLKIDALSAKNALGIIKVSVKILEINPNIGKPSLELEPEHRELIILFGASGYIVLYRYQSNSIIILSIKHQKEVGY